MKDQEKAGENTKLSTQSQNRLIAYTTAASLGAFFTSPHADAQVVLSPAFPSYPVTILPPPNGGGTYVAMGPNGFSGSYHYFSIDGGTNNDFFLTINNPITTNAPSLTNDFSQFVQLFGTNGSVALTPNPADPYLVSCLGGTIISASTASVPTYEPRLAVSYFGKYTSPYPPYGTTFYNYLDNKYFTTGALGFEFVGKTDGQPHFGYMDVVVNSAKNSAGFFTISSVVIQDIYYNATANAAITVPTNVVVSSITVGAANAVTINFGVNSTFASSAFSVQTSAALGHAASWTNDSAAVITQIPPLGTHQGGQNQLLFKATTTATGGASQYYRIVLNPN